MSFFVSVGILILATLIMVSLQLIPSVFSIFYHYASGKNSRQKADDLTLSFVLGAETFNAIIFLLFYIIYFYIFINLNLLRLDFFPWIMSGVFFALSIVAFFFYFKKGSGTELFISRRTARGLCQKAKTVKTRSDAFLLGFFSGTGEVLFTIPLFITVVVIANAIDFAPRTLLLLLFIVSVSIPVFSCFLMYRSGYNFAEITRRRIKNKPFFRFIISIAYILLVVATITMGLTQ